MIIQRGEYWSNYLNYWDVLISVNWIVLGTIKTLAMLYGTDAFPKPNEEYEYHNKGPLTEEDLNYHMTVVYIIFWCMQSILLWTRTIFILQRSKTIGPLINTVLQMIYDVVLFSVLLGIVVIGFLFAFYYLAGTKPDNGYESELTAFDSTAPIFSSLKYTFETVLGQQDWEVFTSEKCEERINNNNNAGNITCARDKYINYGMGDTRSRFADLLITALSVFGNILMLNLLIAIMTSTYDRVRSKSTQQVNYLRINSTRELATAMGVYGTC